MNLEITIIVDTNDVDYATRVSEIDAEDLEKIKPLLAVIKKFKPYKTKTKDAQSPDWTHSHNYPYGECLREDLGEEDPREHYKGIDPEAFDILEEHLPYTEYGFHTIKSVYTTLTTKKVVWI